MRSASSLLIPIPGVGQPRKTICFPSVFTSTVTLPAPSGVYFSALPTPTRLCMAIRILVRDPRPFDHRKGLGGKLKASVIFPFFLSACG